MDEFSCPASRQCPAGFSLIEIMISLAILSIILAVAIPAFSSLAWSMKVTSATNDLLASLHLARIEAIRRGTRVTVCAAPRHATDCQGTAWHEGWMIFVHPHPHPGMETKTAAHERILSRGGPAPSGILIQGNGPMKSYVSFVPTGVGEQLNGAFLAGTIRVCAPAVRANDASRMRDIVMSSAGRIIVRPPSPGTTGRGEPCPPP